MLYHPFTTYYRNIFKQLWKLKTEIENWNCNVKSKLKRQCKQLRPIQTSVWFLVPSGVASDPRLGIFIYYYYFAIMKRCQIAAKIAGSIVFLPRCVTNVRNKKLKRVTALILKPTSDQKPETFCVGLTSIITKFNNKAYFKTLRNI